MSDKAKYGYLAGIIDGEGHIRIQRNIVKGRKTDGTDCISYICSLGARNTDFRLIRHLIKHFGGTWYPSKPPSNKPTWKKSYNWQLFGNYNLQKVLLAVLPYLQLKKSQAKLALEFLRLEGQRCPEKREALCEQIGKLNVRGITVETNMLDSPVGEKIEPVLIGNNESMPAVTQSI